MTTAIENPKAYRLPQEVRPRRYDIALDARVGRPTFTGRVKIQVSISGSRTNIELHAFDLLTLTEATLTTGNETLKGEISQDAEREMARIEFGRPLPAGDATLEIAYDGRISPTLEGLYLAKDGPIQCLCTQCEETDARKIFPCWDEPVFKAQFAWTITTDAADTVLTNGPLLSVEESADGKSKTWTFAPTKLMSSYLCALVIGDIAGTQEEVVNGIPIRVWAMRGKEEMGRFAHEYTKKLLPFYEDYFQAPYHYDKYDQVAVPGFAAGAMENSGLVIYVQSALLMNPQTASWAAEKSIAHVIAHETAHMWFGNLVTMAWWDDLWLNEAFAEWMSFRAIDSLTPEYKIWNDAQGGKNTALAADALESTHPIYKPVQTPSEATELFDAITYQKGSSVMRMLENFLGADTFRAGLRTYMVEFAESNAAGADLWRHLAHASGQPVAEIMETWITQGGYPVIKVALEGTGANTTLRLSQRRFYSSPSASGEAQTWQVPLVIRYADGAGEHRQRVLMTGTEISLQLPVEGQIEWLYANDEEIGFYRQNPDAAILKGVLANLDKLSPVEQAGLLSDQWALTRNGTQGMTAFLDVLSAMTSLSDYTILENVVGRLHTVRTFLKEAGDEEALTNFKAWVAERLKAQMDEVGYEPREGESQNDAQRRISLVDAMASVADAPEAIEQATIWADREAENPASVSPDLAGLFVSAAARNGDRARFDRNVQIYKDRINAAVSPQETSRYLYSLPAFEAPELVDATLALTKDGTIPQEAIGRVLRVLLSMSHSKEAAWLYIKDNWDTIRDLGDMWTGFLVEATGQLPASLRDDMVAFYDEHLNGVAEMSYARALETLDQIAEFKSRTKNDLIAWFKTRK
ncbi:MAG: M1 family metallopeptidase [Chloroflexota bacterium]